MNQTLDLGKIVPVKGIDYWTKEEAAEVEQAKNDAVQAAENAESSAGDANNAAENANNAAEDANNAAINACDKASEAHSAAVNASAAAANVNDKIAIFTSQESTRQSNESTRESNESTRESNESTRESQESSRQSAENTRQSTFLQSEASRQSAFVTNEGTSASPKTENSRWGKYAAAEAQRNASYASEEERRQASMTIIESEAAKLTELESKVGDLSVSTTTSANTKFDAKVYGDYKQGDTIGIMISSLGFVDGGGVVVRNSNGDTLLNLTDTNWHTVTLGAITEYIEFVRNAQFVKREATVVSCVRTGLTKIAENVESDIEEINGEISRIKVKLGYESAEFGNYTYNTSTGAFGLYSNSKVLSITSLISVKKTSVLSVYVPVGYTVELDQYNDNAIGSARLCYTNYSAGTHKVYLYGKYVGMQIKRVDGKDIDLNEAIKFELVNESKITNYHSLCNVFERRSVIQDLVTINGSINNEDGETFANTNQRISQMLPVESGSIFELSIVVDDVYFSVYAYFYHVNEDGTYTWINYTVLNGGTNIKQNWIVPDNANAVMFKITGTGKVTESHISTDFIDINIRTRKDFVYPLRQEKLNVKTMKLSSSDFVYGDFHTSNSTTLDYSFNRLFNVYGGQRLMYKINCETNVPVVKFVFLSSTNGVYRITSEATKNKDSVYVTVPNDAKYMGVSAIGSVGSVKSDVDTMDLNICDVSTEPKNFVTSKLLGYWEKQNDYPQGFAVQNGFAFAGYTGGYTDVFKVDEPTNVLAHIKMPIASNSGVTKMHQNNLTFGPKISDSDKFGTLWCNNESANTDMVCVKVTTNAEGVPTGFEKVFDVKTPAVDTNIDSVADDQYIDFDNNILVQAVYKFRADQSGNDQLGDVHISVYSFDNLMQESPNYTLIKEWWFPRMWTMQGGRVINGVLYITSGSHGSSAIYMFRLATGEFLGAIDAVSLGVKYEMQSADWQDGNRMFALSNRNVREDGVFKYSEVWFHEIRM